jgi:hypothetical protein
MGPIQKANTGKEDQGDLSSPFQALVQFYCAFRSIDDPQLLAWYQAAVVGK